MSKRNLIVAVRDSEYVERLADYIRHSSFGEGWQLTAFTNPAALRGFVRGGYPVDLLAAQPAMLEELGELPEQVPAAALVEFRGQSRFESELLQFQPLPQLLQAFTALYGARGSALPMPARRGSGAAVIAVYSASGGLGKTTLALQLAQQAGILGARSFYLNLEQWNASFSSDGAGGHNGANDDFARLLYTLQSEPEQGASAIASLRKHHPALGMDSIAPCDNVEERLALGAEQAKKLLAAISDTGDYACIVVDLDSRLDALHAGVLEACAAAIWLLSPDAASLRKNEQAMRYGDQKFGTVFSEQLSKFRFIQIGGSPQEQAVLGGRNIRVDAVLPYVEEWASGGQLRGCGTMAPLYRGAVESLIRKLGIA